MKLFSKRRDYAAKPLLIADFADNPFEQFRKWLEEARAEKAISEPDAMSLSTVDAEGQPSARILLLKGVSDKGFLFFTNYQSRKGQELEANPKAALLFFWDPLMRQVRIRGRVEKTSAEVSDKYFHSRPAGAQRSAIVSRQSQQIENREAMDEQWKAHEQEVSEDNLTRPEYWGGYCLIPEEFEFWQGQPNRFHDRIAYRKESSEWTRSRLQP